MLLHLNPDTPDLLTPPPHRPVLPLLGHQLMRTPSTPVPPPLWSHCGVLEHPPPLPPAPRHPLKPCGGLSPPAWQIDPLVQPGAALAECGGPGWTAVTGPLVLGVVVGDRLTCMSPVQQVRGVDGLPIATHRPASALVLGFSPPSHLEGLPQGRPPLGVSTSPVCRGRMYESFHTNTMDLKALM